MRERSITVVTRLEFRRRRALMRAVWLWYGCVREARDQGAKLVAYRADWRAKRLWSISMWDDTAAMLRIGNSRRHVAAAHFAMDTLAECETAVFEYAGDWWPMIGLDRHQPGGHARFANLEEHYGKPG